VAFCKWPKIQGILAERTGLEPATPGVTGRYSNQLNYRSGWGGESYPIGESSFKLFRPPGSEAPQGAAARPCQAFQELSQGSRAQRPLARVCANPTSTNLASAEKAAAATGLPRTFADVAALLAAPEVDIVAVTGVVVGTQARVAAPIE
jgi:hypothetical protein